MKHFLILTFAFFTIFANAQTEIDTTEIEQEIEINDVVDLLSVPGPVEFGAGNELFLTWSKQQSNTFSTQQYLPRDERIEDFNQLLTFSFFNKEIDIEYAVRDKMDQVQKKIDKDKFGKVNLTENPDGTEFIIDYTFSDDRDENLPFVEYTLERFKKYEKSFLILSYSKRIYGDFKAAYKTISKQRDQLMTTMIEYKIPKITLINQQDLRRKK
ncbi:MAG: hypothetical protein LBE36_00105 [Flavobacteriaceae bacterium]|jgi:hypothetical protein|nr:hypothetical protein [Flavobacteriaceae bacterium]